MRKNIYLPLFTLFLFITLGFYAKGQEQESIPVSSGASSPPTNMRMSQSGYGVISGILHDETTKEPVPYASVVLFRQKDSTMVTGNVTDDKGLFVIEKVMPGKYYIRVSFIGYQNKFISKVEISPKSANLKLGEIFIKPSSAALEGVTITAERSVITNNLDKKVITVDKTLALSGGTATDVMENIPNVSVDAQGNVSLRGNSNITILIDGKPATQAGLSSNDILSQLPASSIQSVELVTNPSVKYDPDGTSGIINIVLKKKTLEGFNGQISAMIGTKDKYNGSLNLNYRKNKINLFAGADWRDSKNGITSTTHREDFSPTDKSITGIWEQNSDGWMSHKSLNLNAGVDYTINTRNNLAFTITRRNMNFDNNSTLYTKNMDAAYVLKQNYNRITDGSRDVNATSYALSYKKTFAEKDREFTTDLTYNINQSDGTQKIQQDSYSIVTGNLEKSSYERSNSDGKNKFFTIQSNYIHPLLSTGGRIETGYKVSLRNMDMANMYEKKDDLGQWNVIPSGLNNYKYKENINAVYAIYGGGYKKFKYQGGLRYEYVYTDTELDKAPSLKDNYQSFYPSAHLEYDLGKGNQFQLSYSRRVDRPSPRQKNTFTDYSDPLNIIKGNPDLQPEYTNSLELAYLKYFVKGSFSSTAFYRQTNGTSENISQSTDIDGKTVLVTQPFNVGTNKSYGLEFVGSYNPVKWARFNTNISLYQYQIEALPQYNMDKIESFSWSGRLNASFNYIKSGSLQTIVRYTSPRKSVQTERESNFSMDLSVRQDLLKDRLSLTLRLTDVFNTRNFNSTTYGKGFTSNNTMIFDSRVLYVGFQYRFNNYKTRKPTAADIENMQDADNGNVGGF